MTECREGCGSCCSPVTLPYTQAEASRLIIDPVDADTREWILHDLTPMSRKVAKSHEPYLFSAHLVALPDQPLLPHFYECRHFDAERRVCTNYDNRPGACREWPWKGSRPNPMMALPPTCSFRADVHKEVFPLPLRRKDGTIIGDEGAPAS